MSGNTTNMNSSYKNDSKLTFLFSMREGIRVDLFMDCWLVAAWLEAERLSLSVLM